jgi:hypothetical protein
LTAAALRLAAVPPMGSLDVIPNFPLNESEALYLESAIREARWQREALQKGSLALFVIERKKGT